MVESNGNLMAWGSNNQGELGTGDFEMRAAPAKIQTLQGKKVS